jgi:hypothetical protein
MEDLSFVGLTPQTWPLFEALFEKHHGVRGGVGVHITYNPLPVSPTPIVTATKRPITMFYPVIINGDVDGERGRSHWLCPIWLMGAL